MKISVIIPTYSPGNYLFECLTSLKEQIFQDFTVLLVLNGPQDPYETQITEWLTDLHLTNVKLLYSEEKGVSAARNYALDRCETDYITFLDDDDLLNPEYLAELIKNSRDDHIVAAKIVSFSDADKERRYSNDYCGREFYCNSKKSICLKPAQCPSVFSSSCGKLIPKKMIDKNRFEQDIFCGEDSFFAFQLIGNGVSGVIYSPLAEYRRRVRKQSASRKRYSFTMILKNRLLLLTLYSRFYLRNMYKINFFFFLRRIAAVLKGFFYLLHQK